jgi:hypothetical protein
MPIEYKTSAEYFCAGLQNGFAAAFVFCAVIGFISGGLLGVVGIGLACWLSYMAIKRAAEGKLERPAFSQIEQQKPRPELWWLAFAVGSVVTVGLALSFVAIANYI